jgi:ABC-2 type transport system permease protein
MAASSSNPLRQNHLQAEWSAFLAMVRKELIVMARYPVNFVSSFIQVFLIVAIFTMAGSLFYTRYGGGGSDGGAGNSGITVYGFVLFMFMSDTLWTIGYNIRNEQVQGTLEQLYLTPANKFSNLVSRVTNTLLWTGLLSITGALAMTVLIGELPFKNPWLGLYLLAMNLAGTFGIGFAFAALTLYIKETAQTIANFLQFALLILCANFFPFSALPPFILFFSKLLPLAYGVDAFRSAMLGFPSGFPELAPFWVEVVIISAFGVLMPVVGYGLYQRAERQARARGTLSTY